MKWVKTPSGTLINLDNVGTIMAETYYGANGREKNRCWLTVGESRLEVLDREIAEKYVEKLAAKIGAEEIKLD